MFQMNFIPDAYTEDLLNKHETEVANLKSYYETHKQVLELVAKRETLFHQMIAFEVSAHNVRPVLYKWFQGGIHVRGKNVQPFTTQCQLLSVLD